MTNNLNYYKYYIDRLIAVEPATITLTRPVERDNGFKGKTITMSTVGPLVARIYTPKNRPVRYADQGQHITTTEKILTKGDADIQEGDRFTTGGVEYRVAFVRDYFGICKQAEIEVVAK